MRPCGSPLAVRNSGGGQAEPRTRRDRGNGRMGLGIWGLGLRAGGGGEPRASGQSNILPRPLPWPAGLGRARPATAPEAPCIGVSGPLTGQPANSVPGRVGPRAGVPAQARARGTGRASPGTKWTGPGRVRAGPKKRASGRATGSRTAWPTIWLVQHRLSLQRQLPSGGGPLLALPLTAAPCSPGQACDAPFEAAAVRSISATGSPPDFSCTYIRSR